jgi:carboxymethylenebutenolidase
MPKIVALLLMLIFVLPASAANGKQVSYPSGNETVQAMMYTPAGQGPFPALVVIHEWWGLDSWIKDQASKLADQGFLTLAVDLYRGKVAANPEEAHELSRGLPQDRAARDLGAAVAYLKTQKNVDPKRIGDIGWCMGGGHAFELAIQEPTLAAAVINYGHLATDPDSLKKVNPALLGIFGGKDRGIPVEDVKKFEQQMKGLGKTVEVVIYPEAGHAFENPNNKAGYRAQDAADAWKRTIAFLNQVLKPGK